MRATRRAVMGRGLMAGLAALGVSHRAAAGPVSSIGGAVFPEVVFSGPADVAALAITVDDGPDPETTPLIMDALEGAGVRGTFMLIGENARAAPETVAAIAARGHEIGHHMDRDEMTAWLDDAALESGIGETAEFLRRFAPVRFLRPGWGVPTRRIIDAAARHDLTVVVGDVAPMDTSAPQRSFTEQWLRLNAHPGAILTVHDLGERGRSTAAVIGDAARAFLAWGLTPVTLSELVPSASEPPGLR
ncbi:polysaccharide deacetylase family protein [Amaricoccus sp. W119]|uniref:polysaccharide deacetylase family protein n=1 Tax=Amaricoccus sp. W119 TaxID=3391833 RepID=UPI0039A6C9FD